MILPARAPVRPRIILPETGDSIPLDDLLAESCGRAGEGIVLVGGIGSGKSIALAHAAATVRERSMVSLLDEPSITEARMAVANGSAVIAVRGVWPDFPCRSYRLAPWTNDEFIEYLLARHPQQCGSVMGRLALAADRTMHDGLPEMCVAALDRMAEDESLLTVAHALRREISHSVATLENLRFAETFALSMQSREDFKAAESLNRLQAGTTYERALRLLRHDPVQLLLAADGLAAALESSRKCPWLKASLPRRLVKLTGPLLTPAAVEQLRGELARKDRFRHPMAASLIHATGQGWTPDARGAYDLTGAYLHGAYWAALQLKGTVLSKCDLSGSNLNGAVLDNVAASKANFSRATLRNASLIKIKASGTEFQAADLTNVNAEFGEFDEANFSDADLHGANFHHADLRSAVLNGARFDGADLHMANFRGAEIEAASFADANLEQAYLSEIPLRAAEIRGANFDHACMSKCDFEGAVVPGARFSHANLTEANLTSTHMPGANFSHANLKGAKLGDVNWGGADLKHAKLRGCTFHFGSSRSGLVGSPIASEGSRTGFYTDDFDQQTYRPPEEIRKANLCGADLTGADLTDTDFYLVDLRGAKYTPEQFEHLRRCGAILFDRE